MVLQQQWEISREFGMFATPIAYLIDADGRITADAAVGVDPILALVSRAAAAPNGKVSLPQRGKAQITRRR